PGPLSFVPSSRTPWRAPAGALPGSAGLAVVVVLGAHALEQADRLGEGADALHGPVRHVDGGLPAAAHRKRIGTLLHEIEDHLVVPARRRVVDHVVAIVVADAHVGPDLLDQVPHRRHPPIWYVPVDVRGEA